MNAIIVADAKYTYKFHNNSEMKSLADDRGVVLYKLFMFHELVGRHLPIYDRIGSANEDSLQVVVQSISSPTQRFPPNNLPVSASEDADEPIVRAPISPTQPFQSLSTAHANSSSSSVPTSPLTQEIDQQVKLLFADSDSPSRQCLLECFQRIGIDVRSSRHGRFNAELEGTALKRITRWNPIAASPGEYIILRN